jgi:hypothetical protein
VDSNPVVTTMVAAVWTRTPHHYVLPVATFGASLTYLRKVHIQNLALGLFHFTLDPDHEMCNYRDLLKIHNRPALQRF